MAHFDNIDWGADRRRKRKKFLMYLFNLILYGLTVWAILAWYDWKLLVILTGFVWASNNQTNVLNKL